MKIKDARILQLPVTNTKMMLQKKKKPIVRRAPETSRIQFKTVPEKAKTS